MSLADLENAAVDIGKFLFDHGDLVKDIAEALADGKPKEAIRAAIRGVIVETSEAALREEFQAADERKKQSP